MMRYGGGSERRRTRTRALPPPRPKKCPLMASFRPCEKRCSVFRACARATTIWVGRPGRARGRTAAASETLKARLLSAFSSSRARSSSVDDFGAPCPSIGVRGGPGCCLRNHSSPARAWRSKRANAASFCVSDSGSGCFGCPRMPHSSASVQPARGEERWKGEGRGQEAEADCVFLARERVVTART